MRIRTANGVGFVRLCVALVIVLVVMSGSAFGQDKQSGRAIKSTTSKNTGVQQRSGMGKTNSKKDAGATPLPVRKELEATIQTDPVYVEADRDDNNLKPHEARQPPSLITPPGEPANGGSGLPGGGSGSGSTEPLLVTCSVTCVCSYNSGTITSNQYAPNCTERTYSVQTVTVVKNFEIRAADCNTIDKGTICRGGIGYISYSLTLSETVYPGCGNSPITSVVHTQGDGGGDMSAIPHNVGQVAIGPACNGGY